MGHPWQLEGFVRLALGAWLSAVRSALVPPFFGGQSISGFAVWAKARALWFGRPSGGAKLERGLNRMTREIDYCLRPIGVVRSVRRERSGAPRQGDEGAPDVWIEITPEVAEGLEGIEVNTDIVVLTWLHQGRRDVLKVHPRGNKNVLCGVFATRSPDRPNPLGLHRVKVLEISGREIKVGPLEAIDGTPVVDIKPVLSRSADW